MDTLALIFTSILFIPLIFFIFYIFYYGKYLIEIDSDKNNNEKIIKEGVAIPSFEFNISKSTIGFLLIILSTILMVFTLMSISNNLNKFFDFQKNHTILDGNITAINKKIHTLKLNQEKIIENNSNIKKSILQFKIKKRDENVTCRN